VYGLDPTTPEECMYQATTLTSVSSNRLTALSVKNCRKSKRLKNKLNACKKLRRYPNEKCNPPRELDGEEVARLFTTYYGNQLLSEEFKEFLEDEGVLY
jgi:hypothetical protein